MKLKSIYLIYMHLFYNASQIKMVILVDLSAIFLASPQSILASPLSISVLFRDPIDLLLSCLSQTKYSNTKGVPHARFLRKNTSCQISPTTSVRLQKTLMAFDDPGNLYSESNLFRTFLPRLIRPPRNTPSRFSLVSN